MRDETYFKQVNRRLVAAHLLLAPIDDPASKIAPVAYQAILDSSLLQFYFAVFSYLNELLTYYRRPTIDGFDFGLESLLFEQDDLFNGVNEFKVLQKWGRDNGNVLLTLSQLPLSLTKLALKEKEQRDTAVQEEPLSDALSVRQVNLIAVSADNNNFNFGDVQAVKDILAKFQLLIDLQRENQLEY